MISPTTPTVDTFPCCQCGTPVPVPADSPDAPVCRTCRCRAPLTAADVLAMLPADVLVELVARADEEGRDGLLDAASGELCRRLNIRGDE